MVNMVTPGAIVIGAEIFCPPVRELARIPPAPGAYFVLLGHDGGAADIIDCGFTDDLRHGLRIDPSYWGWRGAAARVSGHLQFSWRLARGWDPADVRSLLRMMHDRVAEPYAGRDFGRPAPDYPDNPSAELFF